MHLDRSEAKYDDGSQSVAFRASDTDVLTVESRHEAFSVNWTARTNSHDFISSCRRLREAAEGSSTIYSHSAKRYLHISGEELLDQSWKLDDIGFIRLNLPSSRAIAWQRDDINHSDTVGCAMSEFDLPFITGLFENTASDALTPLTGELDNFLGFLRYSFKER